MKAWYIMDYQNGNKGIVEEAEARRREREFILSGEGNLSVEDIENCKTKLEAAGASFDEWLENEIDKNIVGYIVGVIYADKEPTWDDLEDVDYGENGLKWFPTKQEARAAMEEAILGWADENPERAKAALEKLSE